MHTLILPYGDCMKFFLPTWTRLSVATLLFCTASQNAFAQADLTSPYSLFGPGVPHLRQTVSQAGVGGSGIAIFDAYKLNLANPAVLALHTEPIFETSGVGTFSTYKTNLGGYDNRSFILNNLSLSFPIKRGIWGLSLGLVPYTTIGYDVYSEVNDLEISETYNINYNGDGGISQGYLGTAYKVYSRTDSLGNPTALSLGGTMNYNFGTLDNNRLLSFPDDPNSVGINAKETVLIRDFSFDFGLHYQTNIVKHTSESGRYVRLLLGAVYTLGADLNADKSDYVYTFRGTSGLSALDTISSSNGVGGYLHIPARITIGGGLDFITAQKARYRVSLDYATQNWAAYEVSFDDNSLKHDFENNQRISGGIEYTPEVGSRKYAKTIQMRAGLYFEKSSLNLRDTPISDRGMSFGLTLPMNHRRAISKSSFSVSAQYGKQGTTDNGLIAEDYWRLYIGFSFTPHYRNRWFVKPKYD